MDLIFIEVAGMLGIVTLMTFLVVRIFIHLKNTTQKDKLILILKSHMQADLVEASVDASEREKQKIARNLHDEINPMITVLKRNLEKHSLHTLGNANSVTNYETDFVILDNIAEGLRKISYELIPSFITRCGLVKALSDYVRDLSCEGALTTQFIVENLYARELKLLPQAELNIYRMCMEIIQNVIKHSSGTDLKVMVELQQKSNTIQIQHNGKGLNNEEVELLIISGQGLGLRSIKARALILNASIDYTRKSDHSFIRIIIPYEYEQKH